MDAKFILICIAVVLACFALVAVLKPRRRDERMIVQPQSLPPMRASLGGGETRRVNVALGREILQLLEEGERPEAVALVREQTGWGAQEASEAVERLDSLRKRVSS